MDTIEEDYPGLEPIILDSTQPLYPGCINSYPYLANPSFLPSSSTPTELYEEYEIDSPNLTQEYFNEILADNKYGSKMNSEYSLELIQPSLVLDKNPFLDPNTQTLSQSLVEELSDRKKPFSLNITSSGKRVQNPLLQFYDNPNCTMKQGKKGQMKKNNRQKPKKEYYRTKLIRCWKKYLRTLEKGKNVEHENNQFYLDFFEHFSANQMRLDKIASTESGPISEKIRKVSRFKEGPKTFNNSYVKEMFKDDVFLESFRLFIDFRYGNKIHEELCDLFDFSCCISRNHSDQCSEKWKILKNFSYFSLLFCQKDRS